MLKAAPDLKVAPGIALAVARYGGNVTENAQQVAGVAKSRSVEMGTARLNQDVGPEADLAKLRSEGFSPGGGSLGSLVQGASDAVSSAEHAVVHNVESIPGAAKQEGENLVHGITHTVDTSPFAKKGGIADQVQQAQAGGAGLTSQIQAGARLGQGVRATGQPAGQRRAHDACSHLAVVLRHEGAPRQRCRD